MAGGNVLCVAEKPSLAKSISAILSRNASRSRKGKNKYCMNYDFDGQMQGRYVRMTMTSVLGHLMASDFPPNYRHWSIQTIEQLFDAPIQIFTPKAMQDVAKNLEQEAKKSDSLIIWTDCDREGEYIGWEILEACRKANRNIQVFRARFSVVQPREILGALQNLQPLDMRQVDAVAARIELDLRIGAAFTRLQTLAFRDRFEELQNKVISYGSCQFPTLGFVVERYLSRERFISEDFWYISASYTDQKGLKADFTWDRGHLFDRMCCIILYERCVESPMATVQSVEAKPTSKWRPLPLTTVALQKFCSSHLRIPSDRVMTIAEDLYNKGFISYPRTETDEFDQQFNLRELIERQAEDTQWGQYAQRLLDGGFRWPRKGKNNDKAHPPIHPTKYTNGLSGDDKRVYELIVRWFLACCSDDAKGHQTNVSISIADEVFRTSGLQIIERNYLDVFTYENWHTNSIPELQRGQQFMPTSCDMSQGKTAPAGLLTEANLIAIMDENGIGTDATIAEHIKKVIDREYVIKEGNVLIPSTLGLALVEGYDSIGLDQSLAKPYLRRTMEENLKKLCQGATQKQQIVQQAKQMYHEMYRQTLERLNQLEQAMTKHFGHGPQLLPPARNTGESTASINRGNEIDAAGAPAPSCDCGNPCARLKVSKEGPNKGRQFFKCASRQCEFFEWLDNNDATETPRVSVANQPPPAPQSYQQQENRSINSSAPSFQPRATQPLEEDNAPLCDCGEPSIMNTVSKEGPNKGRQFRSCRQRVCRMFVWADQQSNIGPANSMIGQQMMMVVQTDPNKPKCDCDLYATMRTVSKSGPNQGRSFWTCTKTVHKCQFFQWCDQAPQQQQQHNVRQQQPAWGQTDSDNGNTCFKCGKAGHFANQCTEPSSSLTAGRSTKRGGRGGGSRGRGSSGIRRAPTTRGRGSKKRRKSTNPDLDD